MARDRENISLYSIGCTHETGQEKISFEGLAVTNIKQGKGPFVGRINNADGSATLIQGYIVPDYYLNFREVPEDPGSSSLTHQFLSAPVDLRDKRSMRWHSINQPGGATCTLTLKAKDPLAKESLPSDLQELIPKFITFDSTFLDDRIIWASFLHIRCVVKKV